MTNSQENLPLNSTEELRAAILSKALSTVALTERRGRADTLRHVEIQSETGDVTDLRISTFEEGSQDDGAIVQVSFETPDIAEAHLVLKDDSMSYEERLADGTHISSEHVDDTLAANLLDKLRPIIEE